jgi:hypothetical protein
MPPFIVSDTTFLVFKTRFASPVMTADFDRFLPLSADFLRFLRISAKK